MIFSAIENGIIQRLKAASDLKVLGYAWKALDTLPADLDGRLAYYIQNFPAAWPVFNGWRLVGDNGDGTTTVDGLFSVVVGAANLRNEKAQRHGAGGQEVGSYQLVADVTGLVAGQDFGLPIGALKLGDCTPLYASAGQDDRKASLFAIGFTSRMDLGPETLAAATTLQVPPIGDFETFAVGWDVPPFNGVADLADVIHPPQQDA